LDTEGLQDGITVNEISQFRKGAYENADKDIQRKWCQVMLHFLPCVCSNYHRWEIKKNTPVSQVTHATDEALVLWFLKCYTEDWDKMYEDKQQIQEASHTNKRRRKEGKHKSMEELGEYLHLHASIKQARSERANGWDEALMEEARVQENKNHSMALPDSMPNGTSANQAAKKTYIMPYSDSEDEMEGHDENGGNSTPNSESV
jgi:hypothetical protein